MQEYRGQHIQQSAKMKDKFGYSLYDGKSHFIFYKDENGLELTLLTAYEDKHFELRQKAIYIIPLMRFFEMFDNNELVVSIDDKQWVKIEGIGEVLFGASELGENSLDEMKKYYKGNGS